METMDTMGRLVSNRFNDLSPKGRPSEHTRCSYRRNQNKRTDRVF